MRERKAIKAKIFFEKQNILRQRLSLRGDLSEALRLNHGKLNPEMLLKMCPVVKIDGAIEIGLLAVHKSSKGKVYFTAGPSLFDENCDLSKALNLNAIVALCAAS
jgi:hypothetical protein